MSQGHNCACSCLLRALLSSNGWHRLVNNQSREGLENAMNENNDTKESERLAALQRYDILDTLPDKAFDRITSLATRFFYTPVALISLLDKDRIWFKSHHGLKSRHGLALNQFPCWPGLCASATFNNGVYVVEDAVNDPRTLANPLVKGEFGLRFYAAAPLITKDGQRLGVLGIMDFAPRLFGAEAREVLEQLAEMVMDLIELRPWDRQSHANLKAVIQRRNIQKNLDTVFPRAQNNSSLRSAVDG
jgi:GAF domain-containing protein